MIYTQKLDLYPYNRNSYLLLNTGIEPRTSALSHKRPSHITRTRIWDPFILNWDYIESHTNQVHVQHTPVIQLRLTTHCDQTN